MKKFLYYLPMWTFFLVLAIIFLAALSCGPESTPAPTFEPTEHWRCIQKETRHDRTDAALDRAVETCRHLEGKR